MGKMIEEIGVVEIDGEKCCNVCKANLGEKGATRFVMHGDGKHYFTCVFECAKCGNMITQKFKRSLKERFW